MSVVLKSPSVIKKILSSLSPSGSISAKDFNRIITGVKTKRENFKDESFTAEIEKINKWRYLVTLRGRHYSENSINAFSFKEKIRYKNAIKKALTNASLIYRDIIPVGNEYIAISPTFFNPVSRDDGNNSATIKIVVDSLVKMGFATDDRKEFAYVGRCNEAISKEWKMEMILQIVNKEDVASYHEVRKTSPF